MKETSKDFRSKLFLGILLISFYFLLSNIKDLYLGLGLFINILNPFIIGFAIAYVLNLPMSFIENKLLYFLDNKKSSFYGNLKRALSIILTFVLVIGFLVAVVLFVVPELLSNLTALINNIPSYINSFEINLSSYVTDFPISPEIVNNVSSSILNAWKELLTVVGQLITSSLTGLITTTINITSGLVNFILSVIFAIYMLASKESIIIQIKKLIKAFLPNKISTKILYLGRISNVTFSKFIAGQCIEALILGFLCFIGMGILRIPYPLLVSVLVGITALIPIFGAFIGTIPAVILIILINPTKALWFVIFIICLQQFEGNVIYPKVVGNSVGLTPILVILAMLVGGSTLGLLGMLIGIPLFSIAYQLIKNKTNKRLNIINNSNYINNSISINVEKPVEATKIKKTVNNNSIKGKNKK